LSCATTNSLLFFSSFRYCLLIILLQNYVFFFILQNFSPIFLNLFPAFAVFCLLLHLKLNIYALSTDYLPIDRMNART